MIWIIGFVILIVALMIPILAIVLDAPVLRNLVEARHRVDPDQLKALTEKVSLLEDQVDELGRAVESLKEENQFLHQLLEQPSRPAAKHLPPPPK